MSERHKHGAAQHERERSRELIVAELERQADEQRRRSAEVADDPVRPNHYASLGKYSAVDVIEKWGLGFLTGNAIKYVQRAGRKPGEPEVRDIAKAIWYLQRHLHELDDSFPDPAER